MPSIISIKSLSKTYDTGFQALKNINLDIERGEIFALLGPNGAGKTTLIGIVCGIVNPSQGSVTVDGHDIIRDYRAARSQIGLVPQEIMMAPFETVWAGVTMSRGLFNKPKNPAYLEKVLKDLSLWDKRHAKIVELSGGMKRRVLIAKALSHEPTILFLDEPTAGVDVELRKDMWDVVRTLRAAGVTIILTTHYIEEAEEMADRVGVINKGEMILVEKKAELMRKLGKKRLVLHVVDKLAAVPASLSAFNLTIGGDGRELIYDYDTQGRANRRRHAAWRVEQDRRAHSRPAHRPVLARGDFRRPRQRTQERTQECVMNLRAVAAIYKTEMMRTGRTLAQSIVSPVISTALYFVVFGAAIGSRISQIEGVNYGSFIVPGLIMLTLLTQSVMNASFGIYFPRFIGTIYELLSAPVSFLEITLGFVGAAATKSIILGVVILATSFLFVPLHIAHPFWMMTFMVLTSVTFSLLGFIIGIWADGFEKLQIVPLLIITPLTFLGGTFYSTSVLPPLWQTVTLFNPVVYLVSGFRWSFFEISDVNVEVSLAHDAGVHGRLPCHGLVDVPHRLQTQEINLPARCKLKCGAAVAPPQGGCHVRDREGARRAYRRRLTVRAGSRARRSPRRTFREAMAQTIASAALAQCQSMGYKVSVVVIDRDGLQVVMLRGDGAGLHTPEGADRKAYTARTFSQPSADFAKRLIERPDTAARCIIPACWRSPADCRSRWATR